MHEKGASAADVGLVSLCCRAIGNSLAVIALGRREDSRLGTTSIRVVSLSFSFLFPFPLAVMMRVRLRAGGKAGKAGTGWACSISSSRNLRLGQGESSGSVAESAHPGGGCVTADSLSPAEDAGNVYSCASAYSAAKYAEAVMLFRDGATVALECAVVVAFRTTSNLACSTCSISSSTLRFRRAFGCCVAEVMGRGTEGARGTRLDRSAGTRSTITLGECMSTLGILIGDGAARFRVAWPVAGLGGTGGIDRAGSGIDIGIGCSLGVLGAGKLVDLEVVGRSMRGAEGEMSKTSSAA